MEVIAEMGPERVRVQDVAQRAGMSPGHVMYYFGNWDRILVDALLLSEADLAVKRDRRVASAGGPEDALRRIARLYLPAVAYRSCRLMDGYSLEVVMGTPGRSRAWAVREVLLWQGAAVGADLAR
jgi:AcrR family transcriptional regulator